MITPRLGLEAGRAVRSDTVAKDAVSAIELAGLADLLRQVAVSPFAVDNDSHDGTIP
jgi:hypothetical protein